MYANILIPTDGSQLSGKAVEHGIALAKRIGAKIHRADRLDTVSYVHHRHADDRGHAGPVQSAHAETIPRKSWVPPAGAAQAAGVPCETVHVEHEHPYQAIIDTAGAKGCDLIVMASHGRRGLSAIVLGSETVKVLTHSKIPVLVHR